MDTLSLILLLLFALWVSSMVSVVILAVVAVKALRHFVPSKSGRISQALKAAYAELFKK